MKLKGGKLIGFVTQIKAVCFWRMRGVFGKMAGWIQLLQVPVEPYTKVSSTSQQYLFMYDDSYDDGERDTLENTI
jgi:hypothetical protein